MTSDATDSPSVPVSPTAAALFCQSLPVNSRIVVLGAGGWFGQTFLALLGAVELPIVLVGSHSRKIKVNNQTFRVSVWDEATVREFKPTFVFDAAFLTRRYLGILGPNIYAAQNTELMRRVRWLSTLPSVEQLVTISSGAVLEAGRLREGGGLRDPYGAMKLDLENELRQSAAADHTGVVIARAFSVSGGFVRKPQEYALSDFVLQALETRQIRISSPSPVFRRYCAVEDFLAVSMAMLPESGVVELDSGGDLVEMSSLAEVIQASFDTGISVLRSENTGGVAPSRYHSDNESWNRALEEHRYAPLNLRDQVANVSRSLVARGLVRVQES